MTRELHRSLSIEGRDDWYLNPLTWLGYGLAAVLAFGFNLYWLAMIPILLTFPANMNVEYESTKTAKYNTD